jgi:hypothetical protein
MGTPSSQGTRIRGRKHGILRARRMAHDKGLCRTCKAKGKLKPADVIDHIQPLATGGEDVDDNCQALCHACHAEKTALEGNTYAVSAHPAWLEPSAIPLTIVTGPPASGKSTYVEQHAGLHDTVICLDTIMAEIEPRYRQWTHTQPELLNKALRLRNAKLGNLARATTGKAWFIVSAPSLAERNWWQSKLGGEIVHLHPGTDECKRRALLRGTPRAAAGVDDWERKSRIPWKAPEARPAKVKIGLDGWPAEN